MCNEQHHLYTLICMCHGYKTRNIVYRYLRVARELAPANKNTEPSRVLCICTAAKSHQVPYHEHAHTHTHTHRGDRSSTVVKALCYKSEGHWFDSR